MIVFADFSRKEQPLNRPARRRRWNNILILSVVAFMAVLNLPSVIKTYLVEEPISRYPYLLDPNSDVQALHFNQWSLEQNQGRWRSSLPTEVAPKVLVERWRDLVGTNVDSETYNGLKPLLNNPKTVEVWYEDQEEPQRITYYQAPQFWLLKNWQGEWIAISVEKDFLFPMEASE